MKAVIEMDEIGSSLWRSKKKVIALLIIYKNIYT
jgi:hypothetical protein